MTRGDMIKVMYDVKKMDKDNISTRGHQIKWLSGGFRTAKRKFKHIINSWNLLPQDVSMATSIDVF